MKKAPHIQLATKKHKQLQGVGDIVVDNGTQFNFKSVITLTLGVLSILTPFLGFLLGILGLIFARKSLQEIEARQEEGRGIAIAGQICSILGLLINGILIILFAVGYIRYSAGL